MDEDPAATFGLGSAPLGVAVILLFVVAFARSHATYWAGRGVVRGAKSVNETDWGFQWWRSMIQHLERWTNSRAARRGLDLVRRWGAVAVTLAYLTLGLQTAVFASAGLIKMPYVRFTIASVPGSLLWAIVWATVGFGAVYGAIKLFLASPLALAAIVTLLAAGIWWQVRRRLARRAEQGAAEAAADAESAAETA